jgi:hypothetical protein
VDMKCVRVESYVVEAGTDRPSPLWGGFAGSSNRWWMIMTGQQWTLHPGEEPPPSIE